MYYSKDKSIKSFIVTEGSISIQVNPEEDDKRFELFQNDTCSVFNNLNNLLENIEDPGEKHKLKKLIYQKTRNAFFELESELPDSSQGVLLFLTGKDYRTNQNEGIYTFKLQAFFLGEIHKITHSNIPFELREHIKIRDAEKWPASLKMNIKSRSKELKTEWLCDPYQLINILTANIKELRHLQTFYTPQNEEVKIEFNSSVKHNRIVINTPVGEVHQSYRDFQVQILKTIQAVIAYFVTETPKSNKEYIAATFILDYWNQIYNNFNEKQRIEQDKIMQEIGGKLMEYDSIPWDMNDLLAAGVQDYYQNLDIEFEDSSHLMQNYAKQFAKLNNLTVEELLRGIRDDAFFMSYEWVFKK